jgi:hypothetical protein
VLMLFLNLISLNFSRLFHCSVFNVLCVLVAVSNLSIVSNFQVLVNNFLLIFYLLFSTAYVSQSA